MVTFLRRLRASLKKCGACYDKDRPSAVLGMGGFTSIAPLIAARRRGIPAFLHESNAIPGKANRLAARFCRAVLLGFDECARHFGTRTTHVTARRSGAS
jgi:UDP-N-acetylglucosamine--N-acetylmuramyl-(pentapeptide) pyrophosphoryl-undecaprenol N-acetylglucosamine transferase